MTEARSNLITDAVAAYLNQIRTALPVLATFASGPVQYQATELMRGPVVFAYPIETTTAVDTREDYRHDYRVGVTITALVVSGDEVELRQMQLFTEAVRDVLKDVDQAGASYLQLGDETAIPEFLIEQESVGQVFVSTLEIDYVQIY